MLFLLLLLVLPLFAQQRGLRVQGKEQVLTGFYDRTWAVIIGIDDYPNLSYNQQLQQAVRDARGVEKVLREQFQVDRIITLYNQQATRENIMRVLLGDLSETRGSDGVFVFFAGHGNTVTTAEGDLGYLLPYDGSFAERENYRNISMTALKNDVAKGVPAKHIFFVMDACYSGLLLAQRGPGDHAPDASRIDYLREITRERVRLVLSAGGKGQTVLDGGRNGHSVFTGRFLQVLEEADGYITGKEIGYSVPEKVFYDAQDRGHKQQPQFGRLSGQGDFVFVRKDALTGHVREPVSPPPTPITPPPAAVQFGHLQVNVNAPNSHVYVDGGHRVVAGPGQPLNLANLKQGRVTVRVTAEGYQEKTQTFSLTANEWEQAVIELKAVAVSPLPAPPSPEPVIDQPLPPSTRRTGETMTAQLPRGATMEMVWIEPGTFTMGSPSSEPGRWDDEGPQHEVTISQGFWLGKYEITQAQWQVVMGTRPWAGKNHVRETPTHPAVHISWNDAQKFIRKLN